MHVLKAAIDKLLRWGTVAFVVILGAWLFGAALGLPLSLVDDYAMLANLDRWKSAMAEHGLKFAIQHDISVEQKIYNTGFWLWTAFQFHIMGGKPYHWIRLIELALVCGLLWRIVIVAAAGRRAAFYAGAAAVVVLLAGEPPYGLDLQGLRINWYRLATSDADALVYLSVYAFGVMQMARYVQTGARKRAALAGLLALVGAAVAFTMKLPFAAVVGGTLVSVAVAAWLCHDRRLTAWFAGLLACFCGLFAVYNFTLRGLHIQVPGQTYSEGFSFAPKHLWEGVVYYGGNYWKMYGPLLIATAVLAIWAAPVIWRERTGVHKGLFLCAVFAGGFAAISLLIYIPWNTRLPRYMLDSIFGVILLGAVVHTLALQALAEIWRRRPWWLLLVPVGAAVAVLPGLVFWIIMAGALALAVLRRPFAAVPLLTGIALTGFGYMLAVTPALKSGVEHVYINRENAGWNATLALLRYSAQGKNVCFVGNVSDEMTGSMAGHVSRMDIEPRLFAASDATHCGPQSVIMTLQWASPPADVAQATAGREIVAEYGAVPGEFPIPVSFWTFRERLWKHSGEPLMVDYLKSEYVWRFYE